MDDNLDCEIPLPNFQKSEVKILQGMPEEQEKVPVAAAENVKCLSHKLTAENDESARYTEFDCLEIMEESMSRVASAFELAFQTTNSMHEGLPWLEEGPDHGPVDSSSDDESKPEIQLSAKHKKFRKRRLAYEQAKFDRGAKPTAEEMVAASAAVGEWECCAELESQDVGESNVDADAGPQAPNMVNLTLTNLGVESGSVGDNPPALMRLGSDGIQDEGATRQPPEAKPKSVPDSEKKASRKDQWKIKQKRR